MLSPLENYRSLVFSILKCDYGWDGCGGPGWDCDAWEVWISASHAAGENAHIPARHIANDIYANGGTFRKRIDGQPNRLMPDAIGGRA